MAYRGTEGKGIQSANPLPKKWCIPKFFLFLTFLEGKYKKGVCAKTYILYQYTANEKSLKYIYINPSRVCLFMFHINSI